RSRRLLTLRRRHSPPRSASTTLFRSAEDRPHGAGGEDREQAPARAEAGTRMGAQQRQRAPHQEQGPPAELRQDAEREREGEGGQDRKSTRLNSSHVKNSYAVFCLKKK